MNRRRFLKLFGAAAAAGAVPAVAGADAAIAFAEKEPVQVEDAFQRLVDAMEDLRRPFQDFGASAARAASDAADFEAAMSNVRNLLEPDAFSIQKLEEAMRLIGEKSAVDLTPNFLIMSEQMARDAEARFGIKLEERRGVLLDRISRATGLPTPVLTSPYCPPDRAFVVPRTASLLDPLSRPAMIVDSRTSLFAAHHEFGRKRS